MKKILSIILSILMIVTMIPFTNVAFASEGGVTLYLKPSQAWLNDNARFSVYLSSGDWLSMSDTDGDGVYETDLNDDTIDGVIFCRMDPNIPYNDWDAKWNSTDYLTYDGTNNVYTVPEDKMDYSGNEYWSRTCNHPNGYENGVCVDCKLKCLHNKYTDGFCDDCGEIIPNATVTVSKDGNITGYYVSLKDAVKAVENCTEEDKAVVKLLDEINLGKECVKVSSGTFTIDLNDKTLSSEESGTLGVNGDAVVTIKNGTVSSSYDYGTVLYAHEGTMYIEDCTVINNAEYGEAVSFGESTSYIIDSAISGGSSGLYVDSNSYVTVSGDSEIIGRRISGIAVYYDSTVEIIGGTVTGVMDGVYSSSGFAIISGGSISGGDADLYSDIARSNTFKLICSEGKDEGPSFPDGIKVAGKYYDADDNEYDFTLKDVIGEGMGYWQGNKMIVLTEGQNEIVGDVLIKAECAHESYTDGVCDVCGFECHHENQKGAACEICGVILHVDEDSNEFCDDCGTLIGAKILTTDDGDLYIDGVMAEKTGSRQLLPTGNYIPAGDITTFYNVYVENGESVTLDLDGYTWYSNTLSIDGAFSLYDTSENETGKIASNDEAHTISVRDNGRFSLYSGAVENVNAGPDACAVAAHFNASINLYGGELRSKVHAVYYSLYSDVTVNLDGTVLECGENHPQFVTDGYSDAPATSVIDVTDYKGGKLAVEIGNSNITDKITIFTGISSAQEAENYTVQDVFEDDYLNISIVKTEYDEATGELSVYLGESTFTQQPSSENNYTVAFNTLDASFLWREIENPLLTSDNVTASAVFENGKWLCGAGKYIELFTFDAKAGDILEISSNSSEEFSLDINNEDWTLEENIDITKSGSFTVSEDEKLTVRVNAVNVSDDLEIEFSLLRIIEELDSETGKTLQNPECSKTYSCQATTKKGYVCSSDAVTVAHTGGTATCTAKAVCDICGKSYGETDTTNHDSSVNYDKNGFCEYGCYEPAVLNGDVYEISNAGQLYWFSEKVNAGETTINGKLMENIVVNEGTMTAETTDAREWTPIGNPFNQYIGTFEGNNKTVSGLYFENYEAGYVGLFGYVGAEGKVQNVGVINSYISGKNYVGGVVGVVNDYCTVTNCYNTGTVSGNKYVGGVIGYSYEAVVTDCYNTGAVSGTEYVGGVGGYLYVETVTNCYNTGAVNGAYCTGGVVGYLWDGTVTGCYNTGDVSSTFINAQYGGGVVGYLYGGTVTSCYNTGTISGTNSTTQYYGGVAGYNRGKVNNCYNTGAVIGIYHIGGVVGYNDTTGGGIVRYCYNIGTVTGNYPVGGVVGEGAVFNCYYLNTCGATGEGTAKTAERFKSGEVAYLLNGSTSEGDLVWGQLIGTDSYPVFGGETVYYNESKGYYNLHTCDFSGEWKYDADKHWKECTVDGCDKISEDAEHSFTDGKCDCGYTCPHSSYTDGVCDKCDYECAHTWGEGVLTRPVHDAVLGSKDGYYTYTCTVCGDEKKETVKGADYSAYDAVSEEINTLLQSDDLTPEAKQAIYSAANECGLLSNDLMESEQNKVDDLVAELQKIVADAEGKIASGEYVKADYTEIDEAIAEIEQKVADENVTDEAKAELEEIKSQLEEMKADGNTSEADLPELEKALEDYEAELDKGIADGTLVKFSGERVFLEFAGEAEKKIDEKHGENAFYDFTNENRDSFYNLYDKYFFRAASLEGGTMAENAENIEYIKGMVDELFGMAENCIAGTHNYGKGVLTRPTFETAGYYTYTCTLCGHSYTEPAKRADDTDLNDASMKVMEYIDNNTLTQEAKDEIYKSYRDILKNNGNIFDEFGFVRNDLIEEDQPAINAVTAELQKIIDEAEEKIVSGEYVKIDGIKEYNKIATALDEEILENYSQEEFAALAEKAGDEINACLGEIIEKAEALTGTVAENKDALAEIESELRALYAEMKNCLDGVHNGFVYEVTEEAKCEVNAIESATCTLCGETDEREVEGTALEHIFLDYASNGDATCTADGTKTAECLNGCGATDTVADEGSMLDHSDEDGDKLCDDCKAEVVDVCPDCGRPVHKTDDISLFICLVTMFIKLVASLLKTIQGVAA